MATRKTTAAPATDPAADTGALVMQATDEIDQIGRYLQQHGDTGGVKLPAVLKALGVRLVDLSDALCTLGSGDQPHADDLADARRTIQGQAATGHSAITALVGSSA